jgi:arabinose-5-phosphate isomerase
MDNKNTDQQNTTQAQTDINAGHRVLHLESQALEALANSLDGVFAAAVELLASATGRVIISGMGKSGHIARKIAATMASIGTPAQFVHPGEASHGDLGMITQQDAVIAISNSGETSELIDLVQYTRRFSIPLISITSKSNSMLAKNCDAALILPKMPEADGMGLAPTTSTTMTLALGDALAIALLERKGFSANDFKIFHPGGKLGQQLTHVKDIMHGRDEIPVVYHGEIMREALLKITSQRFGCAGVLDKNGTLKGVITDGDLRRHMADNLLDQKVENVMTADPITVSPSCMAMEVVNMMNEKRISAIFIVEDKKPVGILHLHDFLHAGVA